MKKNMLCPKISIIVPIYNREDYLDQCLLSLINQTLTDIEIILIDDGSTDNSLEICKGYQMSDDRIRVLSQTNKGVGIARNKGIKFARGEYLSFIDSDDFIEANMMDLLYRKAKLTDADMVFCDFWMYNTEENKDFEHNKLDKSKIPIKNVFNMFDCPSNLFQMSRPSIWNRIFRRETLLKHKIQFPDNRRQQDNFFTNAALAVFPKISFLDLKLLHYRMPDQKRKTITLNGEQQALDSCLVYEKLFNFLKENNIYQCLEHTFLKAFLNNFLSQIKMMKEPFASFLGMHFFNKYASQFKLMEKAESYYLSSDYIDMNFYKNRFNNMDKLDDFFRKNRTKIIPIIYHAQSDQDALNIAVSIQSLIENKNVEYMYDIYITHIKKLNPVSILLLENIKDINIRIRCIDIQKQLINCGNKDKIKNCFFIIQDILTGYDKVIFLSKYAIITGDIVKLFSIDMRDYLIAGFQANLTSEKRKYYLENLFLISEEYILEDVFILNLSLYMDLNTSQKIKEILNLKHYFLNYIEDLLNIISRDRKLPIKDCQIQYASVQDPIDINNLFAIIFSDDVYSLTPSTSIWWKYARKSVVYEKILQTLIQKNVKI